MTRCCMCFPGDYSQDTPLDDLAFCSRHAMQLVNEAAAERAAKAAELRLTKKVEK